jgi:hypothetical protein
VFERAGRRVIDATTGGQCSAFEKAKYSSLERRANVSPGSIAGQRELSAVITCVSMPAAAASGWRVPAVFAATLAGSAAVAASAVLAFLGREHGHWLPLATAIWICGGLAALLLVTRGSHRRIASLGYAAGGAVNALVVARLYLRAAIPPGYGVEYLALSELSLELAHSVIRAWNILVFVFAIACFAVLPFVTAAVGSLLADATRSSALGLIWDSAGPRVRPSARVLVRWAALLFVFAGMGKAALEAPDLVFGWGGSEIRCQVTEGGCFDTGPAYLWIVATVAWFGAGLGVLRSKASLSRRRGAAIGYAGGLALNMLAVFALLFSLALRLAADPSGNWPRLLAHVDLIVVVTSIVSYLAAPHLGAAMAVTLTGPGRAAALGLIWDSAQSRVRATSKIGRLCGLVLLIGAAVRGTVAMPYAVYELRDSGVSNLCWSADDCQRGGCLGACYSVPPACEIEVSTERTLRVRCKCIYSRCTAIWGD